MRRRFGHQGWWPGESAFEVCVGAILTQSTNWTNVERALGRLKAASCLSLEAISKLHEDELAELIRSAGYARVKAKRLLAFVRFVQERCEGRLERAFEGERERVRERLLEVKGIGPETADCMLLYAGGHASFVVDAYTLRIFRRHGWADEDTSYRDLQELCETELDEEEPSKRIDLWQDYHAQLVNTGKHYCRPRNPRCEECPLGSLLPVSNGVEVT